MNRPIKWLRGVAEAAAAKALRARVAGSEAIAAAATIFFAALLCYLALGTEEGAETIRIYQTLFSACGAICAALIAYAGATRSAREASFREKRQYAESELKIIKEVIKNLTHLDMALNYDSNNKGRLTASTLDARIKPVLTQKMVEKSIAALEKYEDTHPFRLGDECRHLAVKLSSIDTPQTIENVNAAHYRLLRPHILKVRLQFATRFNRLHWKFGD